MVSKPPSRPAPPNPKVPPRDTHPSRPAFAPRKPLQPTLQAKPAASDASFLTSETFKKRRTGLWAAGVAVIAGAGALLGAQLKTRQQVQERVAGKGREESNQVVDTGSSNATQLPVAGATHMGVPGSQINQDQNTAGSGPPSVTNGSDGRGVSYEQRQIKFLQDRRGVLMKEKFDLERKIERVREKIKREEEMEGRRVVGAGGDK